MPGRAGGALGFVPLVDVVLLDDVSVELDVVFVSVGPGPLPFGFTMLCCGSALPADCGMTSQSTSPVSGSTYSPFTPRIMRGMRASLSCCGEVGKVLFLSRNSVMAFAYCCMA